METVNASTVSALGLTFTLFLGVMMFILPRRYATIPLIMIGAYVTLGQIINVAGLHFMMLRVMIPIGWLRVMIRGEVNKFNFNTLDKAFICWLVAHIAISIIREPTDATLINKMGLAYDAAGLYFLFRLLVRDSDDYEVLVKGLAVIVIPLACLMVLEYVTGRNPFFLFGGVPEYTSIREERLRCQGPFRHPILAGTFGATTLPLVFSLYFKKNTRRLALIACLATLTIVFTSASSGPLMAVIGVIIGLLLWPLRAYMKVIRWGLLACIIGLHMVMKAPVWYLLAKVSEVTGGTGWHRAQLINQAVLHFSDWWLIGTSDTADWMPYHLTIGAGDSTDITNQFISEGVNGGILTLLLFIVVISLSYKYIGEELKRRHDANLYTKLAAWCIGVSLFAHILSFLSVTYFDQTQIYWYMLLAVVSRLGLKNVEERHGDIRIHAKGSR
jgi:hypothetical protein